MIRITKILICISFFFYLFISCQNSENPVSIIEKEGVWEIISTKNFEVGSIFFINPVNGWAVGMNGSIIHSTDGGKNWIIQKSGTNSTLTSVCFIDDQNGSVTGYKKTLLSTSDGGNTWNIHDVPSDSTAHFYSIHSDINENILFISNHGDIFYSTNFGKEWNTKYSFREVGYSFLFFPNATSGFAMQMGGNKLKRTTDGGNTWITYQLPVRWIHDIHFLDDKNGWFTDNWLLSSTIHDSSSVYITTNGGETWTHQSSLHGLILENIQFVDTKNGWVSDVTKIFHTNNGGESWKLQYQNEDMGFIKDIFFLNKSNGWAITNQGYILKYSVK
jgi:photosystem II stability/assembly factor-like uncharacterized protein